MLRSPIAKFAPALAALTFALTASADLPAVSSSEVTFHAKGPAGLKIDGKGDKITVVKDGGRIAFKTSVKDMKTGIGLRDGHLNDYLDVKTWPDASMTVDAEKLKSAGNGKEISGDFKLHGKSVTKTVKYKADKKDGGHAVSAEFTVNLLDHFDKVPGYLGVEVDKNVKVKLKFNIKD